MAELLTMEEMAVIAQRSIVFQEVLGRPPGADLNSVQLARAQRMYALAMSGTAKPDELIQIAVGERDGELGIPDEKQHASRPAGSCKDCGTDITDPKMRYKSDPARCRPCRQVKKKTYNAAYRGGS